MVITGLEIILGNLPTSIKGKRVGILSHSPGITKDFEHITEVFYKRKDCKLSAIFGPQHGLHGQTQDNMIEWKTQRHPIFNIPIYSLYGEHRKPTSEMLADLDVFLIDL